MIVTASPWVRILMVFNSCCYARRHGLTVCVVRCPDRGGRFVFGDDDVEYDTATLRQLREGSAMDADARAADHRGMFARGHVCVAIVSRHGAALWTLLCRVDAVQRWRIGSDYCSSRT